MYRLGQCFKEYILIINIIHLTRGPCLIVWQIHASKKTNQEAAYYLPHCWYSKYEMFVFISYANISPNIAPLMAPLWQTINRIG